MQVLWANVAELAAVDDRRFRFRLTRPTPLLILALGQTQFPCFIMPERIAQTDPFKQISDYTGSGPYKFVQGEYVSGAQVVYQRFDGYVPRQEPAEWMTGGKVAHFERVVWRVIPDSATAAAALLRMEIETPPDLVIPAKAGIQKNA